MVQKEIEENSMLNWVLDLDRHTYAARPIELPNENGEDKAGDAPANSPRAKQENSDPSTKDPVRPVQLTTVAEPDTVGEALADNKSAVNAKSSSSTDSEASVCEPVNAPEAEVDLGKSVSSSESIK